jgi:hypothetical protein
VGDNWRDADIAHFFEALDALSVSLTRETGKPDVLTFFENTSGVFVVSMGQSKEFPLMVFEADSSRGGEILRDYTLAYLAERAYDRSLDEIRSALQSYYYRSIEDPENPDEEIYSYEYPESLRVLITEGYLEEMPLNPYTGAPMRVFNATEVITLGNIAYIPLTSGCCGSCGGSCPVDEEPGETKYNDFQLVSKRIGGTMTMGPWQEDYEPDGDLAANLRTMRRINPAYFGVSVESDGDWKFYSPEEGKYAFASMGRFLLFGPNTDTLIKSRETYESGNGFHFSPPDGFETEDAFYRDQADLTMLKDEILGNLPPEMPSEAMPMMGTIMGSVGLDALESQHTSCWLRNGDIESLRRIVLTGDAQRTLIGSLVYSDPKELMTARGGPVDLIGEMAWANPGEYIQGVLDFVMETALPLITAQTGTENVNPGEIMSMLGINQLDPSQIQQANILLTASEDRGNGLYLPGLTGIIRTDNPDLGYMAVGIMDTLTLMVPRIPIYAADFEDENAKTWLFTDDKLPISPTIAWCDGYVVKSLWREDALRVRDALQEGTMLAPDGMAPANARIYVNRQELMRGIADVLYVIPEECVPAVGGIFELAAQLSGPDERLYIERVSGENYVDERSMFSIGLFEDLVPVFSYVAKAMSEANF